MTGRKPPAGKAAVPLLLRDPEAALSATNLRVLFEYLEAHAQTNFDKRDSAHDRLFGAVMAQVDVLQAHRAAWLRICTRLSRQLTLWPLLLRAASRNTTAILESTGLLAADARRHVQVTGLVAVLAATLQAWRTDTGTDLPATLRACDTALRRGGTAIAWLGLSMDAY